MNTNPNDPINPTTQSQSGTGLTKREYFALIAMQGILSNYQNYGIDDRYTIEMLAVKKADALIAELNKP